MPRLAETAAVPGVPLPVGSRVRVSARFPAAGHIRAPFYLRGKAGEVIRYFGVFQDPTALAAGSPDIPARRLYQVAFPYAEVWGAAAPEAGPGMTLVADLYDNWLEPLP